MTYFTATPTIETGFLNRFAKMAENFSKAMARRRLARITFNELSALPDRELNELGMSRTDIRRISKETAYNAI